jgi:hypothetical protein
MQMSGESEERGATQVAESIEKLLSWVHRCGYKGYEPFDALLSPLKVCLFGNPVAQRIFIQVVRQCPINLRPMIGIRPHYSSMGMGCMASGYLNMHRATGRPRYRERAIKCLEWLIENKSPYFKDFTWGHHFDWVSRGGPHPKMMPSIVWTSLIGHTFLDAYEELGNVKYLEVAASICCWILELPKEVTSAGTCISYVHFRQDSIHNSNMLGASMLARYGRKTNNSLYIEVAGEAMRYSCERQLPEGGWFYGEAPMHRWIDNFHTAYNIDSLKSYLAGCTDGKYGEKLKRALEYYKAVFIEGNGQPRYYDKRAYPIDIQCASQSITTLSNFAAEDKRARALAWCVARWTIENMQSRGGYFYYRRWPGWTIRTPMFHWGQATMFKALSQLLAKSSSGESRESQNETSLKIA